MTAPQQPIPDIDCIRLGLEERVEPVLGAVGFAVASIRQPVDPALGPAYLAHFQAEPDAFHARYPHLRLPRLYAGIWPPDKLDSWVWFVHNTGRILVDLEGHSFEDWASRSASAAMITARMSRWRECPDDAMAALGEGLAELYSVQQRTPRI